MKVANRTHDVGRVLWLAVLSILVGSFWNDVLAQTRRPIPPPGTDAAAPPANTLSRVLSASIKWSVPERYPASWRAWQRGRATYEVSYVQPEHWTLILDGCGSRGGGERITSYEWTVQGVTDRNFVTRRSVTNCKLQMPRALPSQGRYDVTLTVKAGAASNSVTVPVEIKDWLVVSLGDSFSSGEGNPDFPGSYSLPSNIIQACKGQATRRSKRAVWKDRTCHRSALSAPALTAEHLERQDDKSSVTFLSYACSGATTEHLISDRYLGKEPRSPLIELPPQIEAVKDAVGSRTIDVLLLTIGINDLDFSGLVTECALPHKELVRRLWATALRDQCLGSGLESRISGLEERYARLAQALKQELRVNEVYIAEYPHNILEDANGQLNVCECLDVASGGINVNEMNFLGMGGRLVSRVIANAARVHDWNYINGVTDVFRGHGYCESGSRAYFRQVLESVKLQGPILGGMHPNESGHRAVRDLMVSAVKLGASNRPTHRVTVSFQRVKAGKIDNGSTRQLRLSMDITQRLSPPFGDFLSGVPPLYSELVSEQVPNGRWFDLPAGRYEFSFDRFAPPQPPRHITDFDVRTVGNGKNAILESVATRNNLGEGTHTLVTPDHIEDLFGIEFTISVRRLSPVDHEDPATRPDPSAEDAKR